MLKHFCLLVMATVWLLGATSSYTPARNSKGAAINNSRVTYDPYGLVNWATTERILWQTHDHEDGQTGSDFVTPNDTAGYEAFTFSHYSGGYVAATGSCLGWCSTRRWPADSNGVDDAPLISTLTNIEYYVPGAEEVGLLESGSVIQHLFSPFLTTYIEGEGCSTCGGGGSPVGQNPDGIPANQIYDSTQAAIDMIAAFGGIPVLNHPTSSFATYSSLTGLGGIEMYNNLFDLRDACTATNIATMQANWDEFLENVSPVLWGYSVNDHFGPSTDTLVQTCGVGDPPATEPTLTAANLDRGRMEVLTTARTLAAHRTAVERGAFFPIKDGEATKGAGPSIIDIEVRPDSIIITTAAADETVTWIGNGSTITDGVSVDTFTLTLGPATNSIAYVRANVVDAEGRIVYVQPFTLGTNRQVFVP